jgi:hypothetical protein
MSKLLLFSLLIVIRISAQSGKEENNLNVFHYLEGRWIIEEGKRNIYEEWEIINDTLMSSRSYYVENGDTSHLEYVKLVKREEGIFYTPTVEHNAGAVEFELTSLTDNKAVFENPEHDFPTKIIYHKIDDDRLDASIEGISNGESTVIRYNFRRIK